MPIDAVKIAQMERELEEAKRRLREEDGIRYTIIKREIDQEEWQRIMEALVVREERILFGIEVVEEPKRGGGRPGTGAQRPAQSGGDLICDICGKGGLTKRGLALHKARMHKGERAGEAA